MTRFIPVGAGAREVSRALRRAWRYVLAGALAAAVSAMVLVAMQSPVYEATAPVEIDVGGSPAAGINAQRMVAEQVRVLRGRSVAVKAGELLDAKRALPAPRVLLDGRTAIVRVIIRAGDPDTAAQVADAYAHAYLEVSRAQLADPMSATLESLRERLVRGEEALRGVQFEMTTATEEELESLISDEISAQADVDALAARIAEVELDREAALQLGRLVTEATGSRSPVEPSPLRTIPMAFLGGAVIGAVGGLYRPRRSRASQWAREWEENTGLHVLAVVDGGQADAETAERVDALRGVRVAITTPQGPQHFVVAITSVGRISTSALVAQLARLCVGAGSSTLVVDADLHHPEMGAALGRPEWDTARGLAEMAEGGSSKGIVQGVAERLWLAPAGSTDRAEGDVLATERCASVVRAWSQHAEYTLLRVPPVTPSGGALAATRLADLTVMVASRTESTDAVNEAVRHLRSGGTDVAGLLIVSA